ncbi:hypothetical protein Daesc_000812 [Daldinia eschscholtzii]|uniref:Uncharacterized protein n=1 Tax=Daldinia eschscholtzii TaxID=292717 RepID=A0AAX6MZI2_9PEZI
MASPDVPSIIPVPTVSSGIDILQDNSKLNTFAKPERIMDERNGQTADNSEDGTASWTTSILD